MVEELRERAEGGTVGVLDAPSFVAATLDGSLPATSVPSR